MTAEQIKNRLVPDKAKLLVEGVRSLNRVYTDNGMGWLGHINWYDIANQIGMHPRRAIRTVDKFDDLDLQYWRNELDGYLMPLGLEVAILLDPSLRA